MSSSSLEPFDLDTIPELKTFPAKCKLSDVLVLPLDSALVEEAVDDVHDLRHETQFFEITTTPDIDLSRFDEFFLELREVTQVVATTCRDALRRTHSSPVLSLITDRHSSKDFCSTPIVVPTAVPELNTSDDGEISFEVQPVQAATEPISQYENIASFAASTATDTTSDQLVGFPKISEQPHPQLLGHTPPIVPEPYYKKTPAVER